jgi:predicted ester cyclase
VSIEKNKVAIRRLIEEAINQNKLEVVDEVIASNYVYHGMQEVKGTEGMKQFITMLRTTFPDLHITINDILAEGDMVAYRFILRGTFKGEMMGMAPTGKQIAFPEAHFVHLVGGKSVEETPYADSFTLFQQLGVKPPGQ